ncbi:MAG: hypothetical protein JW876_12495 [Candidatus Krumholzibacteriota bacterium]|nr:hypothetical protein [Candidatus Krumholzibacteriota bacterium]
MLRTVILATSAAVAMLCLLAGCHAPLAPAEEEDAAPSVVIERPAAITGDTPLPGPIEISWRRGAGAPVAVRWLYMETSEMAGSGLPGFDPVAELAAHPGRYEDAWSRWTFFAPLAGGGDGVAIDRSLSSAARLLFAVQARDALGRVTEDFDQTTNARIFREAGEVAPLVTVRDDRLGILLFSGDAPVARRALFEGAVVRFTVEADASTYSSSIASWRWGWDVASPGLLPVSRETRNGTIDIPPRTLDAGMHTLVVEATDIHGNATTARVAVEVVPLAMERPLLWIDDFASDNEPKPLGEMPTESEHDAFWTALCGRATGFDPSTDVWDVLNDHAGLAPGAAVFARYRSVVWTFSSASDAWGEIVRFVPESAIDANDPPAANLLPLFLEAGGHIWTLGRSERRAGLAEVFPGNDVAFPASLSRDLAGGGCAGRCMALRDYCVSVIDKVWGPIRREPALPPDFTRSLAADALSSARLDTDDPLTAAVPGLPRRLDLADAVTAPGMFFDPAERGFLYVELYDPAYWMDWLFLSSRSCFHPLYRMRSRNATSVVNGGTIAFWITSHADVVPPVAGGVAAPSIHCGFPLWFFDHAQADSLVDAVFGEWGIR